MRQSQQVLEWQAEAKAEALLQILDYRLPGAFSEELRQAMKAAINIDQVTRWIDVAVTAASVEDFRRGAGL